MLFSEPIYRSNGCKLLRQRDDNPDFPCAGYWTFFGGQDGVQRAKNHFFRAVDFADEVLELK